MRLGKPWRFLEVCVCVRASVCGGAKWALSTCSVSSLEKVQSWLWHHSWPIFWTALHRNIFRGGVSKREDVFFPCVRNGRSGCVLHKTGPLTPWAPSVCRLSDSCFLVLLFFPLQPTTILNNAYTHTHYWYYRQARPFALLWTYLFFIGT